MDIATGKPTPGRARGGPHHLVDVVDPDDRYHAARFRSDAEAAIADVRRRGRLPVIVGGTGLYIRSAAPRARTAAARRSGLPARAGGLRGARGRAALHAQLAATAPPVARGLHPNDEVRVITRARAAARAEPTAAEPQAAVAARARRAEPDLTSDSTLDRRASWRAGWPRARGRWWRRGSLDEVAAAAQARLRSRSAGDAGIGYRQFVDVALGRLDAAAALALMQRDTVRYAKRQMTWFVREPDDGVDRRRRRRAARRGWRRRCEKVDKTEGRSSESSRAQRQRNGHAAGHGTRRGPERAIIAALRLPSRQRWEVEESLEELAGLASRRARRSSSRVSQERDDADARPLLRTRQGRGDGRRRRVDLGANLFISDDPLSPDPGAQPLGALGIKVIDRTALILDIFAQRATHARGQAAGRAGPAHVPAAAAGRAVDAPRAARRRHRHAGPGRDAAGVRPPRDPAPRA